MSIELELEDNGKLRVRVDSAGERAVSDTVDAIEFIQEICTAMNLDCLLSTGELTILTPSETDYLPKEETEETSAQEDDNV